MKPITIAVLFASLLFNSCGSSKQEKMQSEEKKSESEMIKNPPPGPAPGTCRIIATVETIDRTLKGTSEKDPCGKAPCMATIKIDSVLGYGSAFPKPFAAGQKVKVTFAQTLNPTKDVWPDIQPPLPGLRVNDRFEATIGSAMVVGTSEPAFTIHSYEKK
jgi:hypothetical protein